jgi:monoamine oxidase
MRYPSPLKKHKPVTVSFVSSTVIVATVYILTVPINVDQALIFSPFTSSPEPIALLETLQSAKVSEEKIDTKTQVILCDFKPASFCCNTM